MPNTDFDIFKLEDDGSKERIPPEISINNKQCMSEHEVVHVLENIEKLSLRAISCLKSARNKRDNNIEDISWAVHLSERALLLTRKMANELCSGKEEIQVSNDLNGSKINIELFESYIKLDFPILLAKRKVNLRTNYYDDSVKNALLDIEIPSEYTQEPVTIVFLNCYEYKHAHWVRKDHDNIDLKWIIDTLNNYFFIDDGPFRTSLYQHSTMDNRDHTEIYLVPMKQIAAFLGQKIPMWEKQKKQYQNHAKMNKKDT